MECIVVDGRPLFFPPPEGGFRTVKHGFFTVIHRTNIYSLCLKSTLTSVHFLLSSHHLHGRAMGRVCITNVGDLPIVAFITVFANVVLTLRLNLRLGHCDRRVCVNSTIVISLLERVNPFVANLVLTTYIKSSVTTRVNAVSIGSRITTLRVVSVSPVGLLVAPEMTTVVIVTPLVSFCAYVVNITNNKLINVARLGVG